MPGSENSTAIMFHSVYILESMKTGECYAGRTDDLRVRLMEHNRASSRATKPYVPWRLIYYEAFRDSDDAKRRERYLKTNQGARLLKRMLKAYRYRERSISRISTTRYAG